MNTFSRLLASISALVASLALLWIAQSAQQFTFAATGASRGEDMSPASLRFDLIHDGMLNVTHDGKVDLSHDGSLSVEHY
jgi:hypothetical protein